MTDSQVIRWGFIGCGAVTEVKSGPAYKAVDNFDVVAVMRRNKALAADYARRHGIARHYDKASELINDHSIDAIYIATPPDTHKLYGLQVASAGKPCCIEKPLAPSYADSNEIVDAFELAEQPLFVAYYRRSLPRFNKVKQLLDNGAIGRVAHVSWQLTRKPNQRDLCGEAHWRIDKTIAPGGYFDDLACHGLDLFAYLLGDFKQVKGISCNQQALYRAKDAITACWQHKNGATGNGFWNFGASTQRDDVLIEGSDGELRFSIFEDRPIRLCNADGEQSFDINNPDAVQLHHVQAIRDTLVSNAVHGSTGVTALHTSWVMERILSP